MYTIKDVFLVTGATSGIGMGVALKLLEKGASVIATGRNFETLQQQCENKQNLHMIEQDLSDSKKLDKWVLEISKKYGKLRGLVLSAGIQQILPISSLNSIEASKKLFEVNYFANMQITKGFCDRRANIGKGSSIVFLSSIAAIRGNSGLVGYAASKGALNAATKSLAKEVAKQGIRVNAVLPGTVITPMLQNNYTKEYIENIAKEYPLGLGEVSDIVEPILFLLSDASKWITGTEIIIDGGGSL